MYIFFKEFAAMQPTFSNVSLASFCPFCFCQLFFFFKFPNLCKVVYNILLKVIMKSVVLLVPINLMNFNTQYTNVLVDYEK